MCHPFRCLLLPVTKRTLALSVVLFFRHEQCVLAALTLPLCLAAHWVQPIVDVTSIGFIILDIVVLSFVSVAPH